MSVLQETHRVFKKNRDLLPKQLDRWVLRLFFDIHKRTHHRKLPEQDLLTLIPRVIEITYLACESNIIRVYMQKNIVAIIITLLLFGVALLFKEKFLNKQNQDSVKVEVSEGHNIFKDMTDLCIVLSKDRIEELLGKKILKTESKAGSATFSCQYYITDSQTLTLTLSYLDVDNQKKGHAVLGRTISTNSAIPMDHFVVKQENGLINEIYLVLGDAEYISINRSSGKTVSEEELLLFAQKLTKVLLKQPSAVQEEEVSVPQEIDVINSFVDLVNSNNPSDAAKMMNVVSDSERQAWAVQFNAINSMKVKNIEASMQGDWSNSKHSYKVILEVSMSPVSANAPIPYYGWDNGENTRWIELIKNDKTWLINNISTGP